MNLIINNLTDKPIEIVNLSENIKKNGTEGLVKELMLTTTMNLDGLQIIFQSITDITNIQLLDENNKIIYSSTQYTDYPGISHNITNINDSTFILFKTIL